MSRFVRYRNDTIFPDDLLRPLIEWVKTKMDENAQRANIRIQYTSGSRGKTLAGHAYSHGFAAGSRSRGFHPTEPFVRLLISPRWSMEHYPLDETYKKRAGEIHYDTWQEHFVTLVAHELRHIDQYAMGNTRTERRGMFSGSLEVDAERYAMFVLAEYRKEKPKISTTIDIAAKDEVKECPNCERSGGVALMFGYRRVGGRMISQPYCRLCRAAKVRGTW